MKAISLWQPWATAIAIGSKRVETRHWATRYRGPIAIHAAKRCHLGEMIHISSTWSWCGALNRKMGSNEKLWEALPFGAVVAVARIVDCRPTDSFTQGELDEWRLPEDEVMPPRERWSDDRPSIYAWTERYMGNFDLGRFGWILEEVRKLERPVPFRGLQGIFNVPDVLLMDQVPESAWRATLGQTKEATTA